MPSDKDVKAHVKEVRDRSQYQATRLFISISVGLFLIVGVLSGIIGLKQNVFMGAAIIGVTILTANITKQMSIILIDIADALHYQGAYEKFTAWMESRKQHGSY